MHAILHNVYFISYLSVWSMYTYSLIFIDKGSSTSRKTNENRKGKARQDKKRGQNEEEENEDERGQLRDRTNVVDVLSRAKDQENTPKRPRVEQDITILDNPDKVTSAHSSK